MPIDYKTFKDKRFWQNYLIAAIVVFVSASAYANSPPKGVGEWGFLLAMSAFVAILLKPIVDYFRPTSKAAYENFLRSHYADKQRADAFSEKSRKKEEDEALAIEEANLLSELYALKYERGAVEKSSEEYLTELEAKLSQEQRITKLEAELASERRLAKKYREMAMRGES